MSRTAVTAAAGSAPAPIGPYSHAIAINGLLFCSGQTGLDPETGVLVDGVFVTPGPTGMALLRKLSRHPGQVVSRAELISGLSGGGSDMHAVEVAVGRLRTALGDPRVLQTVVKRGYRLAFDPEVASTGRY